MTKKEKIIFSIISILCFVIWFIILNPLSKVGKQLLKGEILKILFFYVSQGDSSLIITPTRRNILIDAGSIEGITIEESDTGTMISDFNAAEEVIIPYFKKEKIDTLNIAVITHPHIDHYSGFIEIFKQFNIEKILDISLPSSAPLYQDLLTIIKEKKLNYIIARRGMEFQIEENIKIEVLHPTDDFVSESALFLDERAVNNASMVIKLVYKNFSVLFCGDIELIGELVLTSINKNKLKSNIIKIPHHGSVSSTSQILLDYVKPEIAIISCAITNPYGHPHSLVISRLEKNNIKVYRTDTDGTITIESDGNYYKIYTSHM